MSCAQAVLRNNPEGLLPKPGQSWGGHSPKEICLVSCAIQGGGQQQLGVLGLLGPQCPQAHGSCHKEHGEDDLGDEAADVAPGVVEPLDEQGWGSLQQQGQTLQALGPDQQLVWAQRTKAFGHGPAFVQCREVMVRELWEDIWLPAHIYRWQVQTTKVEQTQDQAWGRTPVTSSCNTSILLNLKCLRLVTFSVRPCKMNIIFISRWNKLSTSYPPSCNVERKHFSFRFASWSFS